MANLKINILTLSGFRLLKWKKESKALKQLILLGISKVVYFPYFLIIESEKYRTEQNVQDFDSKEVNKMYFLKLWQITCDWWV